MKAIFLDVDEVLNSENWNKSHVNEISRGELIDESKIALLSKLVSRTASVIVLHSGWRFWLNEKLQPINKEADYFIAPIKYR